VQPGNIPPQVIKAVAACFARAVQINAAEALHNLHMIGHLIFRHTRLAKALQLYVFAVVPADRDGWINDIGNHQHALTDLGGELVYLRIQAAHLLRHIRDALFCLLRLFPLPLCHKRTDLLADRVTLAAQIFAARACSTAFFIQLDYLVDQRYLFLLKLFSDILLDKLRIGPQKFDV